MRKKTLIAWMGAAVLLLASCQSRKNESPVRTAAEILGNPDFPAISYGGYREKTRERVPTVAQLKEDMRILSALGIRILRTYNTQDFPQAGLLLQAIRELKEEDPDFEMYVMLGAWIECKGARTDSIDHTRENLAFNKAEIAAAVDFVQRYPDIVKVIAVGNEAMVHWASAYYVVPEIILKWVSHLQELKKEGVIPGETWITSSDNFASWGGGDSSYHLPALNQLIEKVDYISLHTYPFHDTHYNPDFWWVPPGGEHLDEMEKVEAAMDRARDLSVSQFRAVEWYVASLGVEKPIHIGETGWATGCGGMFSRTGSRAADEYKQKAYYRRIREWTDREGISCFFFEAFDEPWKDAGNPLGSENHFGLFTVTGQAKYVLWDQVDAGIFEGLTRDGSPVAKSYEGDEERLMAEVSAPPVRVLFQEE